MHKFILLFILLVLLLPQGLVLAQEPLPVVVDDPQDLIGLIETIASWLFTIFIALAVVMILLSLFSGNTRTALVYIVVAIVIALLAGGIVLFIRGIIGG